MGLGSGVFAAGKVALLVEHGQLTAGMASAERTVASSTSRMRMDVQTLTDTQIKAEIAQRNYTAAVDRYGPSSTRALQATLKLREAQASLTAETVTATEASTGLAAATDRSAVAAKAAGVTWARYDAAVAGSAAGMAKAGTALKTHLMLPMLALAGISAKFGIDFEKQMRLVETQAGASRAEMERMTKSVLEFARSGQSEAGPAELAKALFHIESSGFRGAEALKALKAAEEGAAVGGSNLETTTNALAGAVKSGIRGAGDFERTMAILNATVGAGNLRMEDLAAALGTGLLPIADRVGISMQEVGAALDVMTAKGIPAEDAATKLKTTFALMASPTDKAKKALEDMGITGTQIADTLRGPGGLHAVLQLLSDGMKAVGGGTRATQDILNAFGRGRSGVGILVLTKSVEDYATRLAQINTQTANFHQDVVREGETASHKLRAAWAEVQTALVGLGAVITPVLTTIASLVGKLAGAFQVLPGPVKDAAAVIIGVLAVGGPLLLAVGAVVKAVRGIALTFGLIGPAAVEGAAVAGTAMGALTAETVIAGAATTGLLGKLGRLAKLGVIVVGIELAFNPPSFVPDWMKKPVWKLIRDAIFGGGSTPPPTTGPGAIGAAGGGVNDLPAGILGALGFDPSHPDVKAKGAVKGGLYGKALVDYIVAQSQKIGLDPRIPLSVIPHEGGFGGVTGDAGQSFGPFQLHRGGRLPGGRTGMSDAQAKAYANSPAGIDFALKGYKDLLGSLGGEAAVRKAVEEYEIPAKQYREGEVKSSQATFRALGGGRSWPPATVGSYGAASGPSLFGQLTQGASPMVLGGKNTYTNLEFASNVDWQHVNPVLLGTLNQLAAAKGVKIHIKSGYRSDTYSASVGGFAGDPHSKGIAVDASIGGVNIGRIPGWRTAIEGAGLRSGAAFEYPKGSGKLDYEHVDLVGAPQSLLQPVGPPLAPGTVLPPAPGSPAAIVAANKAKAAAAAAAKATDIAQQIAEADAHTDKAKLDALATELFTAKARLAAARQAGPKSQATLDALNRVNQIDGEIQSIHDRQAQEAKTAADKAKADAKTAAAKAKAAAQKRVADAAKRIQDNITNYGLAMDVPPARAEEIAKFTQAHSLAVGALGPTGGQTELAAWNRGQAALALAAQREQIMRDAYLGPQALGPTGGQTDIYGQMVWARDRAAAAQRAYVGPQELEPMGGGAFVPGTLRTRSQMAARAALRGGGGMIGPSYSDVLGARGAVRLGSPAAAAGDIYDVAAAGQITGAGKLGQLPGMAGLLSRLGDLRGGALLQPGTMAGIGKVLIPMAPSVDAWNQMRDLLIKKLKAANSRKAALVSALGKAKKAKFRSVTLISTLAASLAQITKTVGELKADIQDAGVALYQLGKAAADDAQKQAQEEEHVAAVAEGAVADVPAGQELALAIAGGTEGTADDRAGYTAIVSTLQGRLDRGMVDLPGGRAPVPLTDEAKTALVTGINQARARIAAIDQATKDAADRAQAAVDARTDVANAAAKKADADAAAKDAADRAQAVVDKATDVANAARVAAEREQALIALPAGLRLQIAQTGGAGLGLLRQQEQFYAQGLGATNDTESQITLSGLLRQVRDQIASMAAQEQQAAAQASAAKAAQDAQDAQAREQALMTLPADVRLAHAQAAGDTAKLRPVLEQERSFFQAGLAAAGDIETRIRLTDALNAVNSQLGQLVSGQQQQIDIMRRQLEETAFLTALRGLRAFQPTLLGSLGLGGATINVANYFPGTPDDPHTFVRGLEFELKSLAA